MNRDELVRASQRAAIFGFPLVENFKALWSGLSPDSPMAGAANTINVSRKLYGPLDTVAVSPNSDTLYSGTVLDLRAEPLVLEVPELPNDRYYSFQFIDALTENPAMLGSRTTGNGAGAFLLVPPAWDGHAPSGTTLVRLSSSLGMTTCRAEVRGADDIDGAASVAERVRLRPLSEVSGAAAPSERAALAWPDYYDAKAGDARGFFERLAWMLQWQEFSSDHADELVHLADVFGIAAGTSFSVDHFGPADWAAIEEGLAAARRQIAAATEELGAIDGCWRWSPLDIGHFGRNHLGRSAVAWKYIYAADAAEAVYPMATVDADGIPLDASTDSYAIRFGSGELPPARFFWSLTMYGADGFLVDNPIDRYTFGNRTAAARYGDDGSLTIDLAHERPVNGSSNWLPAPAGPFYVLLRIYGPSESVLAGAYRLPAITRLA